MRRFLLASCLSPCILLVAEAASARTSVSTSTTAPLKTSAAGDISVTSAGSTIANFDGGERFTLVPDALTDGPLAKLRLSGGSDLLSVSGELRAEEMQSDLSMGLRLGLKLKL